MRALLWSVLLCLGLGAQAVRPLARINVPIRYHGSGSAAMTAPAVSSVTTNGFTVTWTTNQPLTTVLHYGAGSLGQVWQSTALTTNHQVTLSGLAPGTAYEIQAASWYYTLVELASPTQTVTMATPPTSTTTTPVTTTPTPTPTPTTTTITTPTTPTTTNPPSGGTRLFPSSAADWLYSAPAGTAINISNMTAGMGFQLNTHDGGFDVPVEYTDGTHGCTTFTDTLIYPNSDRMCVPNPANGYWPATGAWGADDGHLVVVDSATGEYYDFWKLYVDASGNPTSTNVGQLVEGSLGGNGTPGTTAAEITGLAGDILPGELDCDTCLNHALSVVVPGGMNSAIVGTQAPALKTDGSVAGGIFREGAKIQFDPSVDASTLNASTAVKAILRALQLYGGVIVDQTGSSDILFNTDLPTQPDLTGINLIGQHLLLYY